MKHLFDIQHLHRFAALLLTGGMACAPMVAVAENAVPAKPAAVPAPASATSPASVPAAGGKPAAHTFTVVGYDRSIKQSDFDGLGKPVVLQIQQQLKAIYSNLPDWQLDYEMKAQPLSDGIVGPITLSWLQRYGYSFKIRGLADYPQGVSAHLDRISAFGKAHRQDLNVLLGIDFDNWESAQTAAQRADDERVLRRAIDAELLALINRYRGGRMPVAQPLSFVPGGDGYFYYVLNKEDLAILDGSGQLDKVLAALKDKTFGSPEEAKAQLLQIVGGRQDVLNVLWPKVEAGLKPYFGHLLDAKVLNTLEKEKDPEKKLAPDTMVLLRKLGTVYRPTDEDFATLIGKTFEDDTLGITPDETDILTQATKVLDNYHLDQQALDTIQQQLKGNVLNAGLPKTLLKMLGEIQDVQYADLSVFRSAAVSKIDFGIGMCKKNSPTNNAYVAGLRVDDTTWNALKQQLQVLKRQPVDGMSHLDGDWAKVFNQIDDLRARNLLCNDKTDAESKKLVGDIYNDYLGVAVESVARKNLPDVMDPIRIKGDKCGCALDELPRITYGFYPYWQRQSAAQPINFHSLNRIAFQGLTVDNVGSFWLGDEEFDLTKPAGSSVDFVRIAHQYNSKVDWLIQKNDWDGDWASLSKETRREVLVKLRTNIVALLTAPLTDTASKLQAYTALGLEHRPRRGDGVTLYFPNYPTDSFSVSQFNTFLTELRSVLDQNGLELNILVTQDALLAGASKNGGRGAFGLVNLIQLRKKRMDIEPGRPGGPENDEFLLVLLNEPSSDAKKTLRAEIENDTALHGSERADFLRSILPVLHFDNRNWQQFEDDIVYTRDNFGGLGLWAPDFHNLNQPVPDPSLSCVDSMLMSLCLGQNYEEPSEYAGPPGWLETTICVQRWPLRLVFAFLMLVLAALIFMYFRFCGAQNFIKRYFPYCLGLVLVPAMVLCMLLLTYDPLIKHISRLALLSVVLVACMGYVGVKYVYLKRNPNKPRRDRSRR